MTNTDEIIANLVFEAHDDRIALWDIAKEIEYFLNPIDEFQYKPGIQTQEKIQKYGMKIVEELMNAGLRPGEYHFNEGNVGEFCFWSGETEEQLSRIKSEWAALGRNPTYEEPICWFSWPNDANC